MADFENLVWKKLNISVFKMLIICWNGSIFKYVELKLLSDFYLIFNFLMWQLENYHMWLTYFHCIVLSPQPFLFYSWLTTTSGTSLINSECPCCRHWVLSLLFVCFALIIVCIYLSVLKCKLHEHRAVLLYDYFSRA